MVSNSNGVMNSRTAVSPAILLIAGLLLAFPLYYPTLDSFFNIWTAPDSDQSHGFLLFAVCLYIFYEEWKARKDRLSVKPRYLGLIGIIVLSLFWMMSGLVYVESLQQALFIAILAMIIFSFLGLKDGVPFYFPVLLLLSVVPVWKVLAPYLQTGTAVTVGHMLQASGITSVREGYLLIIPEGTFEVAEFCSGLRYQIVGITISLLYARQSGFYLKETIAYVAFASLLAFVANLMRVYSVVVIGHLSNMESQIVHDHNMLGWTIFGVFILIYLWGSQRYLPIRSAIEQVEGDGIKLADGSRRRNLRFTALVFFATLTGPALAFFYMSGGAETDSSTVELPGKIADWRLVENKLTSWKPDWLQGNSVVEGRYSEGAHRVDVFLSRFSSQEQGREAISVLNEVYDSDVWSRIYRRVTDLGLVNGRNLIVEETRLKAAGSDRGRIVWRWYNAAGKREQKNIKAKLLNLLGTLKGNPEIDVNMVSYDLGADEDKTRIKMVGFLPGYLAAVEK